MRPGSSVPRASACHAALLAGATALLLFAEADAAHAQFFWGFGDGFHNRPMRDLPRRDVPMREFPARDLPSRDPDARRPKSKKATVAKPKRDVPIRHPFGENMPKGPLQLIISINDQRAILYANGIRIGDTKVSTGTASHPTPTGVFSVIQKNRWHRSNLYDDAPMYYMHRLTWSGIALHEGHLPGFAASHGCIRMPTAFVSRLWSVSKLGMRVVVARSEVAPREFSHAKLFNPAPKPADPSRVSEAVDRLRPSLDVVESGRTESNPAAGQGHPIRVAEAQPLAEAVPTASDAPSTAASADVDALPLPDGATLPPPVAADIIPEPAVTAASAASPAPADAAQSSPAAGTSEPDRPAVVPGEVQLPRPAPLRARSAEPAKRNGQVAVFISRKEKRIFVRHAFVPLFDMPVEIADPDKPFGTHTYTALGMADDGTSMRWNVISVGPAGSVHAHAKNARTTQQSKTGKSKKAPPAVPVPTIRFSDASEALDRVTIPQEAVDRIAELLVPGSSLIISDEGLGRETGRYTEFIVETRH